MIATSATVMLNDLRYGRVPDQEKFALNAKLAAMMRIDAAPNKRQAIIAEARRPHGGRVYSVGALRKMYYGKWLDGHRDWTRLINRARVPEAAQALPESTVKRWHELCYQFRGKHKAAHRALKRAWEARDPIPGFEGVVWTPELPAGLSYENLMKKRYRPTKFADAAALVGLSATAPFAPGILTTRAGLAFGSRYVFDDLWHDFKVNVPGQTGARRLLQFHCIELLSACQCARGMKPEILNDQSGRFERLKEREFLFLLAHVLGDIGYNALGCILMMEHGTTHLDATREAFLADITDQKVIVDAGPLPNGSPLAPGLYAGRSKGNFRFKAALESLGNLIHNETADRLELPAQTGSNSRLNAPDELHGIERYNDALLRAMVTLPPALRDLISLPATPLIQAIEFADMVQERINNRRDHDLEGWAQCGFVTSEFRLHPTHEWSPMTQLIDMAPALRAAAEQAIDQDARLSRQRQLSPREVFDGLRPTLTKIRPHHIPAFLGMEHADERRVAKDGRFAFEDQMLGPGDHIYDGVVRDDEGHAETLPAGEKFATFVSTIDPSRLHVCDARGRYLGWCERTLIPSKADAFGFAKAAGRKMAAHRELLAPVLAAARPIIERQRDAAAHNDSVFAQAAAEPAPAPRPKVSAEQLRRNQSRAEQLAARAQEQLANDS